MNIVRVDHTGIVVHNLDEAVARYERLLGGHAGERTPVPSQGVEIVFLAIGDTQLELLQPVEADSGIARFLQRRGEGLHHVAVLVSNLDAELARLAADGIELIDRDPRPGAHGRIAFVHPRAAGGVLLELIQHDSVELDSEM